MAGTSTASMARAWSGSTSASSLRSAARHPGPAARRSSRWATHSGSSRRMGRRAKSGACLGPSTRSRGGGGEDPRWPPAATAPSFAHVGRIEECNPMATNLGTGGKIRREDALEYHATGRPGKLEIAPTKPVTTARDLSLAYSPGVAEPCREIAKDADLSYRYTARGNLVACISNGTAVLGLGDIGPYAAKPVMEGKGVLFKKFADIDVFDIEIDA